MAPADAVALVELAEAALSKKKNRDKTQQQEQPQSIEAEQEFSTAEVTGQERERAAAGVSLTSCSGSRVKAAVVGLWTLTAEEANMVQRFDPSASDLDTIGFFIAKFVKH